uniref:Uncharacterized protein n=1 Tax=Meloidogyne floridensis TaxID=298350 RepID=A0A915ND54_9BILA
MTSTLLYGLYITIFLHIILQDSNIPPMADAQVFRGFVDGSTSGSILNNLWGRKKRLAKNKNFEGGNERKATVIRKKRQFFDRMTSGTILDNMWG